MELAYFIICAISLVVLICFFKIGRNIGKIRLILERENTNNALDEYHKYLFLNDKKQAIDKLKDAFWFEFKKLDKNFPSQKRKLEEYKDLQERYSPAFNSHNLPVPDWDGEDNLL